MHKPIVDRRKDNQPPLPTNTDYGVGAILMVSNAYVSRLVAMSHTSDIMIAVYWCLCVVLIPIAAIFLRRFLFPESSKRLLWRVMMGTVALVLVMNISVL